MKMNTLFAVCPALLFMGCGQPSHDSSQDTAAQYDGPRIAAPERQVLDQAKAASAVLQQNADNTAKQIDAESQ